MVKYHHAQSGFTIIELMIGIGILAILMGIGVPAYQDFIKNNCLTTTSVSLVSALQFARTEAVKRRENVSVVANTDVDDADGDSNITEVIWAAGWTVQDSSNNVLRRFYRGSCNQTTMTESGANTTITYASTGFLNTPTTANFFFCDDRNNQQTASAGRHVSIAATGRPNTDKYTGTSCP